MPRIASLFLLLVFILAACNTSSGTQSTAIIGSTSTATATVTATVTETTATLTDTIPAPSATAASNLPTATPPAQQANTSSNTTTCTPRTDWTQTVTVVSGNTLSQIATSVNASVDELVEGNCLSSANTIQVGQILRVPRLPDATPVPTGPAPLPHIVVLDADPMTVVRGGSTTITWEVQNAAAVRLTGSDGYVSPNLPLAGTQAVTIPAAYAEGWYYVTIAAIDSAGNVVDLGEYDTLTITIQENVLLSQGLVNISPSLGSEGALTFIPANTAVTVSWAEAPAAALGVEFFALNTSTGGEVSLGLDNNLSDGASVTWTVPADFWGVVWAFAAMPDIPNYQTAGQRAFKAQTAP